MQLPWQQAEGRQALLQEGKIKKSAEISCTRKPHGLFNNFTSDSVTLRLFGVSFSLVFRFLLLKLYLEIGLLIVAHGVVGIEAAQRTLHILSHISLTITMIVIPTALLLHHLFSHWAKKQMVKEMIME